MAQRFGCAAAARVRWTGRRLLKICWKGFAVMLVARGAEIAHVKLIIGFRRPELDGQYHEQRWSCFRARRSRSGGRPGRDADQRPRTNRAGGASSDRGRCVARGRWRAVRRHDHRDSQSESRPARADASVRGKVAWMHAYVSPYTTALEACYNSGQTRPCPLPPRTSSCLLVAARSSGFRSLAPFFWLPASMPPTGRGGAAATIVT